MKFEIVLLVVAVISQSAIAYKRSPIVVEEDGSACDDTMESDHGHRCGKNEVWYKSTSMCSVLCPSIKHCVKISKMYNSGCNCKRGYARIKRGSACIPIEKCPSKVLLRQEMEINLVCERFVEFDVIGKLIEM